MKATNLQPGEFIRMDGFRHSVKFVGRVCRNGKGTDCYMFQCESWKGQNGPDDQGCFELTGRQVSKLCSFLEV